MVDAANNVVSLIDIFDISTFTYSALLPHQGVILRLLVLDGHTLTQTRSKR